MKKKMIVFSLIVMLLPFAAVALADSDTVGEGQAAAVSENPATPAEEGQKAAVTDGQKARLNSLFKAVKEKSKSIKPAKYEVTLPVSTAGARGAETRQADRFAVIWPDAEISPITALAENLRSAVEQGEEQGPLRAQLEEFKKVFPEFNDHELFEELNEIIKQTI